MIKVKKKKPLPIYYIKQVHIFWLLLIITCAIFSIEPDDTEPLLGVIYIFSFFTYNINDISTTGKTETLKDVIFMQK